MLSWQTFLVGALVGILSGCGGADLFPPLSGTSSSTTLWSEIHAITPYVVIGEDRSVVVNETQAYADGVPEATIRLATQIAALNNEVLANPDQFNAPIDPASLAAVEEFFLVVANGVPDDATSEGPGGLKQDSGGVERQIVCGGGPDQPHPCPSWKTVAATWNSSQAVINRLLTSGYHKTAGYASGYNASDYTMCVSAYSCGGCRFRTQAILYQSGNKWGYRTQTPEPNPEIFSYVWPAWWWGTYVRWWHFHYC